MIPEPADDGNPYEHLLDDPLDAQEEDLADDLRLGLAVRPRSEPPRARDHTPTAEAVHRRTIARAAIDPWWAELASRLEEL